MFLKIIFTFAGMKSYIFDKEREEYFRQKKLRIQKAWKEYRFKIMLDQHRHITSLA